MAPITESEWYATIRSMNHNRAPGPSGIPYEFLSHLGPIGVAQMISLFNDCLHQRNIPELWRKATVFSIPKPMSGKRNWLIHVQLPCWKRQESVLPK